MANDDDLIRRGDALKWERYGCEDWKAASQFGEYRCIRTWLDTSALWLGENKLGTYGGGSHAAAKAAAQADYEARILAALEPVAAPVQTFGMGIVTGGNPLTTNPVDDSQTPDPVVNAPAEDAKAKGETDGQTLERLDMDGAKWAAEFRTTALRLGYSDMDEGWLIGWFANAIMAGYDRKPAPDAHVNETPKTEHDAGNVLTPAPDAPTPQQVVDAMKDAAAVAMKAREAALREAIKAVEDALNVPCAKCGVPRAEHHHRHPFVPTGVTDPVAAILALITEKPHDRA